MVRRRSTVRFREGALLRLGFIARTALGGVAQGQSKRLIIAESVVRVHPPLLRTSFPGEYLGSPRSFPVTEHSWTCSQLRGNL